MDFCTELTKGAISKLGELAVESTLKQFKYLIKHKKITDNLKEEVEKLKALKQSLQGWVNAESTKGNEIPPNLLNWLSSVASIEVELQSFYKNSINMNKKCFGKQCLDLALNYSQGKQATAKTEDVTRLKEEGSKLPLISYPKPPPTLGSTFTKDVKSLDSRNKIIIEVIEKLKDDQFKRISICGMGGVGKTTLVKELIKTVENKLFDKVVMAVVSQNPDYDIIQRQIADGLGLVLRNQSVVGRGWEILDKFKEFDNKKAKLLIVLDDVWQELNFEWIGLSSQSHQKNIKILFTSRDEKVCQKMGSQKNVQVSVLLEDEAWSLFREMAGDIVNRHDIYPIAREVANECGGLPLAIATVARVLSNEEKISWEDALRQMRDSQSSTFSDMQEYVYSRIELSFNLLGSVEHKSFLFLCALFPEDFDISVESILRHGMGLGLFVATDAVWKARNHLNCLVNNLKKCFLLLDSEKRECVKMHDVVRDVIIKISSREELGIWVQSSAELKQVKQKHKKWLRMSIILDAKIDLENIIECPTLELLQVMAQRKESDIISIPENFVHGVTKLKVLYIQNLCIPVISYHSHSLINLHTLQLEGCDVGDISVVGKVAKRLEILSFANSNVKELPYEIGDLGFLKVLDLTGCDYLNIISANVLPRLSQLEELYFRIKNFPWLLNKEFIKDIRNISTQLKVLEIKLRKLNILPNDLIFKNLEKFWVFAVPYTPYPRRAYLGSNIIQLRALDYNSIKSSMMIMQLIKKCESLLLEKVKDLKNVISELDDCGLQFVKDLRLDYCPDIECVVDCNTLSPAFPLMKSLSLSNLFNMTEIFRSPDHIERNKAVIEFSNLEELQLWNLKKLTGFSNTIYLNEHHQPIHYGSSSATNHSDSVNAKLFSSNWMKQFPKLETMLLVDCVSIETIFDLEGYSEITKNAQDVLFPQLRKLEISGLHSLLYVWDNGPCCDQGFLNLRFLKISRCNSLKYVFTSVIVREITNLEKLEVRDCKMMENIVVWSRDDKEDVNTKRHCITNGFNKLSYLSLSCLPRLVNVYSDSRELECPSLTIFKIDDCPMLEISLLTPYIHTNQENINVTNSANMENADMSSLEVNTPSSSKWAFIGCRSFLRKFIRQRNTNNRVNKELSLPQAVENQVPYIFETNSNKVKCHMPILEDLCIIKFDLLDVVFLFEEKFKFLALSHLKTIKIENCHKLKVIMARTREIEEVIYSFTRLESLHLKNLPNLVGFCFSGIYESLDKQQDMDEYERDQVKITCYPLIDESLFPNITSLFIGGCHKINILFSYSSMSGLKHLQKLEVRDCKNMEEIISQKIEEDGSYKIMFHALRYLLLINLPNLKAFSQWHYTLDFPSLQKVDIENCSKLEVFSTGFSNTPKLEELSIKIKSDTENYIHVRDINVVIHGFKSFVASKGFKMLNWTKLHNDGYLKNSKICVNSFNKLLILVSYNEMHMLQHMRELNLSNCDSLVEMFESGGGVNTKMGGPIMHYQLEIMKSDHLPKLSHIWRNNIVEVVSFHKLTNIDVSYCHNLKSLISQSMARSLVQLQKIAVADCEMMEEIITKEDQHIDRGGKVKILLPKLEELKLFCLPRLECVCSGNYDYDISLQTSEEEKENNSNNNKVHISFPQLKHFELRKVPNFKCFCLGAYDYDILASSSEECPNVAPFFNGNVFVHTPRIYIVKWDLFPLRTFKDLNLTTYYFKNSNKYKARLQKLETFRGIEQDEELIGYIKSVKHFSIENCHKLLSCIPSNMTHLMWQIQSLYVWNCERLEEIFEPNNNLTHYHQLQIILLSSLPKLKLVWKTHGQILGFQHLEKITIKRCNNLRYVFSDVSVAISLPRLFSLEVCECKKMHEIIKNNSCVQAQQEEHKSKIIFPLLGSIVLEKLPNLKCFSRSLFPCYIELPCCIWISIEDCPKMSTFWYNGSLYTPTLYTKKLADREDDEMNEIIQRRNK